MLQNEITSAVFWLVGGLVVAFIVRIVLNNYIKKLFEKTKTDLDDQIFGIISAPIFNYIALVGLYIATKQLSLLDKHQTLIDNIFYVITAFIVAQIISRVLASLLRAWISSKGSVDRTPKLLERIISVAVYALAIVWVLGNFGVQVGPILAALGVGGLAIGLALKDTLSNIFSGVYIISDRPARVGDFIELSGGIVGTVEDIGWRTSKIRTRRNHIVVIPNTQLAESIITNYDIIEKESNFSVACGVGYGEDLENVEKIVLEEAKRIQKEMDEAVDEFEPAVRFREFGDSNINFITVLRSKSFEDKGRITHEFIKTLKKRFDKEKIEISYPVRKIIK